MDPLTLIFLAIIFVISISLHEYAHAWASDKLGDPTPRIQGRLTPNPLVHIDLIGFVMIFIIQFGRGKPVQINPSYYKHPLRDELLVALAGPITNIILATIGMLIIILYTKVVGASILYSGDVVIQFWQLFSFINIILAVFNMIPIFPLDGYRVIKYFSPSAGYYMEHYRQYFVFGLLALIFLPSLVGLGDPIAGFISSVGSALYQHIFLFLSVLFV